MLSAGQVYVEGLESGISYEDDDESPDENEDSEEEEEEEESRKEDTRNEEDSKTIPTEKQNNDSRPETTETDELSAESKSLDDPTASSKDIAKVLMMLSREPVNHDSKVPGRATPDEDKLLNGAPESDDGPTRAALEAVSALNTMKANCGTRGLAPAPDGSDRSVTVNQTCRSGSKSPDESDGVVAAAKAVAAKAVASTSHLLYPSEFIYIL